jgi:anti-sigma B factor antagonist
MNEPLPARNERVAPPVVKLTGEIDLAVAPSLQDQLQELRAQGATTIVVDLLEATFLDSIALGILVDGLRRCREAGGDMRLIVVEPRILKVLEITGLSDLFTLYASADDAKGATGTGWSP